MVAACIGLFLISSKAPPPRVRIAEMSLRPDRYRGKLVTVTGCFGTDPYHGSAIFDEPVARGVAAIPVFGGSDMTLPRDFDWMRDATCGTFVGRLEWHPREEPLSLLCPGACFVIEKSMEFRVVPWKSVQTPF
jgi:hypothetical protein